MQQVEAYFKVVPRVELKWNPRERVRVIWSLSSIGYHTILMAVFRTKRAHLFPLIPSLQLTLHLF